MKSPGATVVSRTSARMAGVTRRRRGRVSGKGGEDIAGSLGIARCASNCRKTATLLLSSRRAHAKVNAMRKGRWALLLVVALTVPAAIAACGSRTGLLVGEVATSEDAGASAR